MREGNFLIQSGFLGMDEGQEEKLSRGEWFAIVVAVIVSLSFVGFQLMQAETATPDPINVNSAYTIEYPGLTLTKTVTITPKGHEERLSAPEGADVVLLAVVPKALEENLTKVQVGGSGKTEKLAEYSLIVVSPKDGKPVSLALKFDNNYRNASAITLALPSSFYKGLSAEEKNALFAELKGFELVWLPPDKVREIELRLAQKVSGVLAE